jgi:hypothetical protein
LVVLVISRVTRIRTARNLVQNCFSSSNSIGVPVQTEKQISKIRHQNFVTVIRRRRSSDRCSPMRCTTGHLPSAANEMGFEQNNNKHNNHK